MWEVSAGLHSPQARSAPASARRALLEGFSVVPVVSERPELTLGRRSPRPSATTLRRPVQIRAVEALVRASGKTPELGAGARARCVDAAGVPYRRSANLLDVVDASQLRGPEFGDELAVLELRGEWMRANLGWLPLTVNGKRRFVLLEPAGPIHTVPEPSGPQVEARIEELQRELSEAKATLAAQEGELAQLRPPDEEAPLVTARALQQLGLGLPSCRWNHGGAAASSPQRPRGAPVGGGEAPRDRDRDHPSAPAAPARRGGSPGAPSPPEAAHAQAQWHSLVRKRTYASWARVRIPVRTHFVNAMGESWLPVLKQRLSLFLEPHDARLLEVVAAHSLEEEASTFLADRPGVPCRPHHEKGVTADPDAMLPAVGDLQVMQWYGELAAIRERAWVVELALSPTVSADAFAAALTAALRPRGSRCRPAPQRFAAGGTCSAEEALASAARVPAIDLNEIVPRQVRRVFAWPAATAAGEAPTAVREVLPGNPPAGAALRAPGGGNAWTGTLAGLTWSAHTALDQLQARLSKRHPAGRTGGAAAAGPPAPGPPPLPRPR